MFKVWDKDLGIIGCITQPCSPSQATLDFISLLITIYEDHLRTIFGVIYPLYYTLWHRSTLHFLVSMIHFNDMDPLSTFSWTWPFILSHGSAMYLDVHSLYLCGKAWVSLPCSWFMHTWLMFDVRYPLVSCLWYLPWPYYYCNFFTHQFRF